MYIYIYTDNVDHTEAGHIKHSQLHDVLISRFVYAAYPPYSVLTKGEREREGKRLLSDREWPSQDRERISSSNVNE